MPALPNFEERNTEIKKYRFEQLVFTVINGLPTNNVQTFYEYHLKKQTDSAGNLYINIKAVEQYTESQPANYADAIKMVNDVQLVLQNDITVLIDKQTGKIKQVVNHQEVIERWQKFQQAFYTRYEFLRSEENKAHIDEFLALNNRIASDEKALINSLETQLFFYLFFDRHLVTIEGLPIGYTKTFHSQLFVAQAFTLQMQSKIGRENPDLIELNNSSRFDKQQLDLAALEAVYNEKYLPIIHYPFSEYEVNYQTKMLINPDTLWLQSAEIDISEAVKNNLALTIHGKLREIE